MQRRTAVKRGAALGTVLLAGCTGMFGGGAGTSPIEVVDKEIVEGADGRLVLKLDLSNTAGGSESARLRIDAEVGEEQYERVREVTLDGGASETISVEFDEVSREEFRRDGLVSFEIEPA